MPVKAVTDESIREAAALLRGGHLVAFPTETVYGIGANAFDERAVARIFEIKGRPSFNPVIVHVADAQAAEKLVEMDDRARAVAARFWPGPLTLILPRRDGCPVSGLCSAGLPTLAVRAPAHAVAQKLLKECGFPLAAPSANKSGTVSATTPAYVAQSFGDEIDMVLASGPCAIGLESTVLDLSGSKPAILRPGAVTAEDLAPVLGGIDIDAGNHEKPKSPGQLLRHYAPSIPLRLSAVDLIPGEALLAFGSEKFMGIRGGGAAKDLPDESRRNLSETGDLNEAAANLFRMLHELDRPDHKSIAVMNIPEQGLGIAINDRLRRAARRS
ncbi:MAG: threonylcarbamoyl-AMP synthase [Proteobacteria bacterium]|nr:threonylcarbamoyl-AMP synthase [Pseudomonadota bacterium]